MFYFKLIFVWIMLFFNSGLIKIINKNPKPNKQVPL